jgi:hypothetical protein
MNLGVTQIFNPFHRRKVKIWKPYKQERARDLEAIYTRK